MLICAFANMRRAALPRGPKTDRPDRLDDDDDDGNDDDGNDDDGDDYNDKRIMVDDGQPRYTGLTAKQRRMLL